MLSQSTPVWTSRRLLWPRAIPTSSEAIKLRVRAYSVLVGPTTLVKTPKGYVPAPDLKPGTAISPPRPAYKLDSLERTPRSGAAFMAGVTLLQVKLHDLGRRICTTIYGSAPDPALDHEDPSLYGHWLLGMATPSRNLESRGAVPLRTCVSERDLALLSILNLAPVPHGPWNPDISQGALQATIRAFPRISLTATTKINLVQRTTAPMCAYPPGDYTLPTLHIRIP